MRGLRHGLVKGVVAALIVSLGLASCVSKAPERPGVLTVSKEQEASWLRNFNPFATAGVRWPTEAGIYEPMLIFNSITGRWTPWLATAYRWEDTKTLRFTLREDVRWSDGQPLTVDDVVFTFELMKTHRALDKHGVWAYLASVEAIADGGRDIRFRFQRAYSPGLGPIAHHPIVAKHTWKDVADPINFKNETPIGTGPFTEVLRFEHQVFELGANPHYWQLGKPGFSVLRMPAYPSNDQANLALANGEVDWAGNFVPAVERTFVARDPENNGYWFPLIGSTVFLYLNTTKAPFDDVGVRKAISMGINRDRVVEVAMYNYTRASDATGLNERYDAWRDAQAVETGRAWMAHDVAAANAILDEAGYARNEDGFRTFPESDEVWEFDIIIVSGWSDWVRAAQVIARNLAPLGIDVSVKVSDMAPWYDRLQKGDFDMAIAWSMDGPSPYAFYRWLMSADTVKPVGELSLGNWHRYGSARAATLLRDFEATTSDVEQKRLATELQRVFANEAPAIPLFPNPSWGVFSTKRIMGFPTKNNPYAALSPNHHPESLMVLTQIQARDDRLAENLPANKTKLPSENE
ncbi:MAG: peptide/nickel transport system substrate-binding protein [Myxococcota bacterium]